MSDDIDKTTEREEKILAARIKNRASAPLHINNESGICYQCGNTVDPVTVSEAEYYPGWCSAECRKQWEDEQ